MKKAIMKNPSQADKSPKLLKLVFVACIVNLVGILALFAYNMVTRPKTAYVDLSVVYSGFEMKKEKEAELQSWSFRYKNTLDSLALEIRSLEGQVSDTRTAEMLNHKKNTYLQLEHVMQRNIEEMEAEADAQIWTQINTYTQEYGEAYGYDYIYGGNGSGSLMYAKNRNDVSKDVLAYINKKYAGE